LELKTRDMLVLNPPCVVPLVGQSTLFDRADIAITARCTRRVLWRENRNPLASIHNLLWMTIDLFFVHLISNDLFNTYAWHNPRMATPIREACLDEHNEPNSTAHAVQQALAGGCPRKVQGKRCGGRVVFDPMNAWCVCERCPGGAAYDPPFGKIVFKVIDAAQEEEAAQETAQRKVVAVEHAKRKAAEEARLVGAEVGEYHMRPDGRAPEGMTWSYSQGKFVDNGWLAPFTTPKIAAPVAKKDALFARLE
jgi:hypothetical protein